MNERIRLKTEMVEAYLAKNERNNSWLARQLLVSPSYVGQILRGKVPQAQTVLRLAAVLGVTVEELIEPKDGQRTA